MDVETIWQRIVSHAGERFETYRGLELRYVVEGDTIRHNRTSARIHKSSIARALEHLPLDSPAQLKGEVTGSAYVYAILMDRRVRQTDW